MMRRMLRSVVVALSVTLVLWITGRWATAATEGDYRPYTSASTAEQVSAPLFVVIAYSAIWLLVLLFVMSVWLRQRRVEAELAQVRQQLEKLDGSS